MNVHKLGLPGRARDEVKRVVRAGWSLTHRSKHIMLRSPGGSIVMLPASSSDSDVEKIICRRIRKIEQGEIK